MQNLAVPVGGLRGEPAALNLSRNKRRHVGGGHLFKAWGFDNKRSPASILPLLRRALLCFRRQFAAGDVELVADDAERIPKVVDVRLGALAGLERADVPDIFA